MDVSTVPVGDHRRSHRSMGRTRRHAHANSIFEPPHGPSNANHQPGSSIVRSDQNRTNLPIKDRDPTRNIIGQFIFVDEGLTTRVEALLELSEFTASILQPQWGNTDEWEQYYRTTTETGHTSEDEKSED